jgi:hypothetical protein
MVGCIDFSIDILSLAGQIKNYGDGNAFATDIMYPKGQLKTHFQIRYLTILRP